MTMPCGADGEHLQLYVRVHVTVCMHMAAILQQSSLQGYSNCNRLLRLSVGMCFSAMRVYA